MLGRFELPHTLVEAASLLLVSMPWTCTETEKFSVSAHWGNRHSTHARAMSVRVVLCMLCSNTAGSGPLPDGGEGCTSKGIDQERLALLERQAPAFIILDFRWGGWFCWEGDSGCVEGCRAMPIQVVLLLFILLRSLSA